MPTKPITVQAKIRESVRGVRWDDSVQDADEARRMRAYVRFAERNNGGPVAGMCKTCAFRPGTEANSSAQVLEFIEHAMVLGGRFGCHAGLTINPANGCIEEDSPTICRGFTALVGAGASQEKSDV